MKRALKHLMMVGELHPAANHGCTRKVEVREAEIKRESSHTKRLLKRNEQPNLKTLDIRLTTPPDKVADQLDVSPDVSVWRIRVLRYMNGHPSSVANQWILSERTPGFDRNYGKGLSTHAILSAVYGIRPVRVRSWVSATAADYEVSHLMHLPLHYPLLRIESVNNDSEGHPIEYSCSLLRSDSIRLGITPTQ